MIGEKGKAAVQHGMVAEKWKIQNGTDHKGKQMSKEAGTDGLGRVILVQEDLEQFLDAGGSVRGRYKGEPDLASGVGQQVEPLE